jgi:hypothetical protein
MVAGGFVPPVDRVTAPPDGAGLPRLAFARAICEVK